MEMLGNFLASTFIHISEPSDTSYVVAAREKDTIGNEDPGLPSAN